MNSLYGRAMSKKFLVGGFKWVKNKSQFNEGFVKNCKKDSNVFTSS